MPGYVRYSVMLPSTELKLGTGVGARLLSFESVFSKYQIWYEEPLTTGYCTAGVKSHARVSQGQRSNC